MWEMFHSIADFSLAKLLDVSRGLAKSCLGSKMCFFPASVLNIFPKTQNSISLEILGFVYLVQRTALQSVNYVDQVPHPNKRKPKRPVSTLRKSSLERL